MLSALRPGRDGLSPPARRARGVRGERDRPRALVRVRPGGRPVSPVPGTSPRALSSCSTPAARCTLLGPPCARRGPALAPPRPAAPASAASAAASCMATLPRLGSAARAPAAAREGCSAAGCAPAALGRAGALGGYQVRDRFGVVDADVTLGWGTWVLSSIHRRLRPPSLHIVFALRLRPPSPARLRARRRWRLPSLSRTTSAS